ncbi:hypothetical protein SHIRM173S_12065 [Streptomyces hirsutus]
MATSVDSLDSFDTGRLPAAPPGPVPWVAMYHSVGDCSDDPYRITATPERLEEQLPGCAGVGCGACPWPTCSPPVPGATVGTWSG